MNPATGLCSQRFGVKFATRGEARPIVGKVWDLWNGFCFLAIFRITLFQIDWCLFHY